MSPEEGSATCAGPATRTEIIDQIGHLFDAGPVSRDELVAAAEDARARTEVVAVLGRLPSRRFPSPHDLWNELPDVPIDA